MAVNKGKSKVIMVCWPHMHFSSDRPGDADSLAQQLWVIKV